MEKARGIKNCKPRFDVPPPIRQRAAKSENKEGRTPRIFRGSVKLTVMEHVVEAQITCWVDGGDFRQKLRERPRGVGTTARGGDESLVRNNRQVQRGW